MSKDECKHMDKRFVGREQKNIYFRINQGRWCWLVKQFVAETEIVRENNSRSGVEMEMVICKLNPPFVIFQF